MKPYIRIQHIVMEIIGYLFMVAALVYAIIIAATVEGEVPTHYTLSGEIDGYGSPAVILIMPIIMMVTTLVISACIHLISVKQWNMPFKINPDRAVIVYSDVVTMMEIMVLLFGIYTLADTLIFLNPVINGGIVALIFVAALFADVIVCCIIMKKHNNGNA